MSNGKLGAHKAISAGTYNVYQTPASTYSKVIVNVVADVTTEVSVTLYISPTNSPSDQHVIQFEKLDAATTGFVRTAIVLNAGEWLSYNTTGAGVHVIVSGAEFPTNSLEVAAQQLVNANTEVVLYEVPASRAAALNIGISTTGVVSGSNVTGKLYVSTSSAASGHLLIKKQVGTDNTGFEYTGLSLGAGEKVILVTDNISGAFATRVHGFIKQV